MAANLIKNGHDVSVFDIDADNVNMLVAEGARSSSPESA